jgi:LysM repeat protein
MSTTAPASWVGRSVGVYRVLLEVGRGRSGVVYLAEDTAMRQTVALKVYPPGSCGATALQAAQQLQHVECDGVARVFACGQEDGSVWVAGDYVRFEPHRAQSHSGQMLFAKNLSEYVSEHAGLLEERMAAELMVAICDALLRVHAQARLGYGGLHPHNLLLQTDAQGALRVMLTDIGVSGGRMRRTAADAYLSPEELQGQPATESSDVYGLGALAYLLLTGTAPPSPLIEPSRIRDVCDPGWDAVVRRALAYEPERRQRVYQDVRAEVAAILARVKRPLWRKFMRVVYYTNMLIGLLVLAGALAIIIYKLPQLWPTSDVAPVVEDVSAPPKLPTLPVEPPAQPQTSMVELEPGPAVDVPTVVVPGAPPAATDILDTTAAVAIAGDSNVLPAVASPTGPTSLTSPTESAAAPESAAVPAAQTSVYVVKPHDTLWRIARAHGMTVADLLALNGLADGAILKVGQQLQVRGQAVAVEPAPPSAFPGALPVDSSASGTENRKPKTENTATPSAPTQYTVQPGDTYYSIARKFGCTPQELQQLNTNQPLKFDQVILVPAGQPHE